MRYSSAALMTLAAILLYSSSAAAIDVVVRRNGSRDGGNITTHSKTEVTVSRQVGGDVTVPVNEIAFIEWDGAPATMGLGRTALDNGQLDAAQKQLEEAQKESAGADKPGLRGDLDYLLAKVFAERAMTDADAAAEAVKRLKEFVSSNRDHYRLYDAQLALGETSLAVGDYAGAVSAYTSVGTSPWKDFQMAAQIGQGRVLLAQKNIDGAKREFDAVAAMQPDGPAQASRRLEALLGQASCLQLKDQFQEAVGILEKVIDESTAADRRLQAEAYVRQGDCYIGMGGNPKDAIMAYLHVDVIPELSKESDLHAESLYHLAQLWREVGQDDRAREAAEALTGQYPDSAWAKKLAG